MSGPEYVGEASDSWGSSFGVGTSRTDGHDVVGQVYTVKEKGAGKETKLKGETEIHGLGTRLIYVRENNRTSRGTSALCPPFSRL